VVTGTTVIAAEPLRPSVVAEIVAFPVDAGVTNPEGLTVATLAFVLFQVTARPVSVLPEASVRVTFSCSVLVIATVADGGVTVTDATGGPDGSGIDSGLEHAPITSPIAVNWNHWCQRLT
jgi:hypothetical protein